MSCIASCLFWSGCKFCLSLSKSGTGGVAEMLSKFRKLRNFIAKFGSFGDKVKSDFSIWWLGSKTATLLVTNVNITATCFGSIEDMTERLSRGLMAWFRRF